MAVCVTLRIFVSGAKNQRTKCGSMNNAYRPRLDTTRETSSIASSSRIWSEFCTELDSPPTTEVRPGGPYTLGNDGVVTEVGLELPPVSPVEVVGDSGGGSREEDSVIRDSENVRSSDWARF